MKLICNRESLSQAFAAAAAFVPSRTPSPAIQNVLLDASNGKVVLRATDYEVSATIPLSGVQVERKGSVLLPADKVGAILRVSSDDSLVLDIDKDFRLTIKGERTRFAAPTQDAVEFPKLEESTGGKVLSVPAVAFTEAIRKTIFAADSESSRYALGGLYIDASDDETVVVATDGRRLSAVHLGVPGCDATALIPSKSAKLIERTFRDSEEMLTISIRGNDLAVSDGSTRLTSRQVEGRFPKWRDHVPNHRNSKLDVHLQVGPLCSAITQAGVMDERDVLLSDMLFEFGGGMLRLSTKSQSGESDAETVIPDTPQLAISFRHKYIVEMLRLLSPESTVRLTATDGSSAVLLSVDKYQYVVMPITSDRKGTK